MNSACGPVRDLPLDEIERSHDEQAYQEGHGDCEARLAVGEDILEYGAAQQGAEGEHDGIHLEEMPEIGLIAVPQEVCQGLEHHEEQDGDEREYLG